LRRSALIGNREREIGSSSNPVVQHHVPLAGAPDLGKSRRGNAKCVPPF
jgi:hypothetical protein